MIVKILTDLDAVTNINVGTVVLDADFDLLFKEDSGNWRNYYGIKPLNCPIPTLPALVIPDFINKT